MVGTNIRLYVIIGWISNLALSGSEETSLSSQRDLYCYTCMSDNVPLVSKTLMNQTINLPEYAQSAVCNGPIPSDAQAVVESGIKLEQCESSCVKVSSENKYLKLVVRGCMDKLFATAIGSFQANPSSDAHGKPVDNCDQQKHESSGLGETVTDTCLCSSNYCNQSTIGTASIRLIFSSILAGYALSAIFL